MPEILQIATNAVNAKIIGASVDVKLKLTQLLSYEVESEGGNSFKKSTWDGRESFFDFKTCVFPAGFVYMVNQELQKDGYQVQIATVPLPEPLGPEIGTYDPFGFGFTDAYEYQPRTVKRLLKYGRMVAQIATGGGKSNIAILTHVTLGRPTIFLTTRKSLAYQMKRGFEKAGLNPGFIGDGSWAPRKNITIAMVQTLASRLADESTHESTKKFLEHVEVLIGEEAHEVGGSEYWDITRHCRNAYYRLALTATPFMRAYEEANMRLQGAFGSIGIVVTEDTLIERGILAKPYFKILETPTPALLRQSTKWPVCYEMNVVENRERLKADVIEIYRAAQHGLTSMVLVTRKNHGLFYEKALESVGLRVRFIFGKHEQEERQEALNMLEKKEIDVLIGSTILDVGVDVPSVGLIVIAGGYKAEVQFRQRIGRGLRRKKYGPNVAFIIDHADQGNKYTHRHALQRRAILEATPGFSENILPLGEDFPYHLFKT